MTRLVDVVDLIIFDFDGTICESADVKTEAFYHLYLDEQGAEFASAVRDYHLENAGVSRFAKINHVEKTMLRRPGSDERIEAVANRFGDIVRERVIAAPLVAGAEAFLGRYSKAIPMVIASATPTEELRSIVAARALSSYFEAVQGSPALKETIVANYLLEYEISGERAVVVGDQYSDLQAAHGAGTLFVGLRPPNGDRLFGDTVVVVHKFDDLAAAIIAAANRAD